MRHAIISAVMLSALSGIALGAEYLEQVESEVYQTKGTVPEITKRAKEALNK